MGSRFVLNVKIFTNPVLAIWQDQEQVMVSIQVLLAVTLEKQTCLSWPQFLPL